MALYEMTPDAFRSISKSSFAALKVKERDDLQRLLRSQIAVLADDLYVLAEEFSDWEDSIRRIDLLAIDKLANLVVIELKRTNDGGHMDLQSIRYASMVSAMTFERAEEIHAQFLGEMGKPAEDARKNILTFLGWGEPDEESFAPDVRIVLVSEDFGKELTTAVLWLRERDIDIRCIRLRPYQDGERCLIDVQQIIPLPEANDYQVQLRKKEQVERKARAHHSSVYPRFWQGLLEIARAHKTRHANIKPGLSNMIGASSGISGIKFNYRINKESTQVELFIDRGDAEQNERIFDQLHAHKTQIEKAFGAPLGWCRLEEYRVKIVNYSLECGDYRSPETEWPKIQAEMVETMIRFEAALKPALDSLGI
jgi:hypothetical protein